MKRLSLYLLLIYFFSLATALFGYWIDTDKPINSFAYQMFEVFALSLVIYVVLLVVFFAPYFLFQFFRKMVKGNR
ncbi:hypothetical protein IVB69_10660 [Flavobacterium sp. J49]|uniref:hypothetical protein n=1 Tax=Flavobacterium sp. J49 TaxID=2718534 RepID=UPI0015939FAC|nr:hypothetical protein [Flavobacterium sp. J49]MBF6641941.1 hypothetical protein [Flavobacterium sp. J49]NIC03188.1 hypothetical protein [Flavobacterium sp. J49]